MFVDTLVSLISKFHLKIRRKIASCFQTDLLSVCNLDYSTFLFTKTVYKWVQPYFVQVQRFLEKWQRLVLFEWEIAISIRSFSSLCHVKRINAARHLGLRFPKMWQQLHIPRVFSNFTLERSCCAKKSKLAYCKHGLVFQAI